MPKVAELKVGLLSYLVGTEHLFALLLDQAGGVRRFKLVAWGEVYRRIDELLQAMQPHYPPRRAASVFEEFSRGWGRRLLPPGECLRDFDILVIIPHHTLHGLPLHAVWLEDSRQFLATSHGVSYCPSATLFKRCVGRNAVRGTDISEWEYPLDGDLPMTAPAVPSHCVALGVDVLGEQGDTYAELARSFAGRFEHSAVGSTRGIKAHLAGRTLWSAVCLVCHGYHDASSPDGSGLLLEGGVAGRREIFLHEGYKYDFRDMPFRQVPVEIEPRLPAELMTVSELKVDFVSDAPLVAIFACYSGAGHIGSADDFSSMACQWLKTGATSAVANVWELNVGVAFRWAPLFLDNWLTRRQPKAVAWRQANRELLDAEKELSPYEWAVISLFGDWL